MPRVRDAALSFLAANPHANAIVVGRSFMREDVFAVSDLLSDIPGVVPAHLPMGFPKEDPYDPKKDGVVVAARLGMIASAVLTFWLAYVLYQRDEFFMAPLLVTLAGFTELVFAMSLSAKTIRHLLVRTDENWEAK